MEVIKIGQGILRVDIATTGGLAFGAAQDFGTTGQVLTSNGANVAPSWTTPGGSLPAISSGQLFVGDATNNPVAVDISGDATISNTGVLTISNNAIGSAEITDGSIATADLNAMGAANGQILKYNGTTWAPAADNTGGAGGYSTANTLPRGDGSGMVDSQIKDNGTSLAFGSATLNSTIFHHAIHDVQRTTMQLNNDYAGASTKFGIAYYDDNAAGIGTHYGYWSTLTSGGGSVFGFNTSLITNNTSPVYGMNISISNPINNVSNSSYILKGNTSQINGIAYGIHLSGADTYNYMEGALKVGGDNSAGPTFSETSGLQIVHADTPGDADYNGGLMISNNSMDGAIFDEGSWKLTVGLTASPLGLKFGKMTGGTSVTKAYIHNTTSAFTVVSDRRLKKNIREIPAVLDKVMALSPSVYHFATQSDTEKLCIGMIAQDVNEIFPELVNYDPVDDLFTLSYSEFGVIAIKAIQEQQKLIEDQSKQIAQLENKLAVSANLQSELNDLKTQLIQIRSILNLQISNPEIQGKK